MTVLFLYACFFNCRRNLKGLVSSVSFPSLVLKWCTLFVDRLQGIIALELEALRQQEEKMRLETVQIKETTDR